MTSLPSLLPVRQDVTTAVAHPDPLRVGPVVLERCDGFPFTDIQNGSPVFGWEGDQRLQLYFNPKFMTWELWRLEHDNEYRLTEAWHASVVRATDITGVICSFLVEHDQFRGYNVAEAVNNHNAKVDADKQKAHDEEMDAVAEAVVWAAKQDGLIEY